jgi:hypothetical protein
LHCGISIKLVADHGRVSRGIADPNGVAQLYECCIAHATSGVGQARDSRFLALCPLPPATDMPSCEFMCRECQEETGASAAKFATESNYSITSSAVASRVGEIVEPSARAVFIFNTTWNDVGCSTGRSAGFAPLMILST